VARLAGGRIAGQATQIHRARAAFQEVDLVVRSWSNHGYRQDPSTLGLLAAAGFEAVCNTVDFDGLSPRRQGGLTELVINVPPDHENVLHPGRRPVATSERAVPVEAWLEMAVAQVEEVLARGGVATLRVHPVCMAIADDFASFAKLCSRLAGHPSAHAAELAVPAAPAC
jgi:hypothetical protein